MTKEGCKKHKEMIEAWANGAEIQYLVEDSGKWITPFDGTLSWLHDVAYRVKPKTYDLTLQEEEINIIMRMLNNAGNYEIVRAEDNPKEYALYKKLRDILKQ